jgi:hypothetical protein
MKFFLQNNSYFLDFINITEIQNPTTDIYQLMYNSGSIFSNYLNPNPQPVSEFSCIGVDFHLDSLLTENAILQSIIQQNYNDYIYYKNLYKVPSFKSVLAKHLCTFSCKIFPLFKNFYILRQMRIQCFYFSYSNLLI